MRLAVLAGLGVTEATGVTHLVATVLRISTPDGTLVVEVDDPSVNVTIEGDGGLVINGAGAQEVRLRPGSYRIQADKQGQPVPLEKELVTIARGDKQIVRVRLEGATPSTPAAAASVERGAFVVLGGKDVPERKYDTLADAVQGASDGDTIEIRGNGPFVTKPILVHHRSLIIRAGAAFRPLVMLDPDEPKEYLIRSNDASLVLEGLDLQWVNATPPTPESRSSTLVKSSGPKAQLHAANCRFLMNRRDGVNHKLMCVDVWDALASRLRNCQCIVAGYGNVGGTALQSDCSQIVMDNCLIHGAGLRLSVLPAKPSKAFLSRNTMLPFMPLSIAVRNKIDLPLGEQSSPPIEVEMSANVVASPVIWFNQLRESFAQERALSASAAEEFLKQVVAWRGSGNYFVMSDKELVELAVEFKHLPSTLPVKTPDDWKRFWSLGELDAQLGQAKFQGGDLAAKGASTPELLTPDDFRLRPDSAGYRAGPHGKDLGADVDLVGPGPAYERWKKTPEYQEWLEETGQKKERGTAKPESGAFLVLGGAGVAERKFDTLAEAVLGTSDGDTIEIRGNGPFLSEPINIQRTALTIRAADGFRPVIKLRPEALSQDVPLLQTNAALVLEGLELHRAPGKDNNLAVQSPEAPLRAANCRFRAPIWSGRSPVRVFRNCEFLAHHALENWRFDSHAATRVSFENCVFCIKRGTIQSFVDEAGPRDVSIQVKCSTFVAGTESFMFALISPSLAGEAAAPIRVEGLESIFDAPSVVGFAQTQAFLDQVALREPAEAEATLLRLMQWRGERNLFGAGGASIRWIAAEKLEPPHGPKGMDEWKQFWGTTEAGSLEVRVRFQGGDLRSRTDVDLDRLTPDDFRLRPDSPGYRAGPDGKDLGADVDLVGPGAAYERWKQTPEYQEWLKETGQPDDAAGIPGMAEGNRTGGVTTVRTRRSEIRRIGPQP